MDGNNSPYGNIALYGARWSFGYMLHGFLNLQIPWQWTPINVLVPCTKTFYGFRQIGRGKIGKSWEHIGNDMVVFGLFLW